MLSTEETDEEHTGPVHGKERANAVELGREDFEDDQRERELGERRANVSTFKRALCCPYLYELLVCEDDGASAMLPEPVPICSVRLDPFSA